MKKIEKKNACNDYQNSKALFVMQIIAMSFAILAVVVFVTVTLFRWISDLNEKIRNSQTRISKIAARVNRLRRSRIKHILKLRKGQKKEEKRGNKTKKPESTAGRLKFQPDPKDEPEEVSTACGCCGTDDLCNPDNSCDLDNPDDLDDLDDPDNLAKLDT